MNGDGPKRGVRAVDAAVLTEELTRLAREITRGANDTIAQLNGGLSAQQRIVEGYQSLLTDANLKIASLQEEVGELRRASVETKRLELEFELRRAELSLKEQRVHALLNTLRDVGGAVAVQYMGQKRGGALPQPSPEPSRSVEAVIADIWPRLSPETVEKLKAEAGTDLVFELLTKVTEHIQVNNVPDEERK
ncbi:hypothetical protein BE11_41950 [Sorangium cellulosum]|nr:hypothetical protein BE11_41950 [Sorangium cellulosum]